MISLLTNRSALTALQSLSQTQNALSQTQNRVSTGLRVASAADNAAYWSIATQMKSDNSALGAVKDALAGSSSTIDVATAALDSTIDVLNKIKTDLVSAKNPGADLTKINTDLQQLGSQLRGVVTGASINGQNWLDGSAGASVTVVSGFHQDATNGATIDTIGVSLQTLYSGSSSSTYTRTGADAVNGSNAYTSIQALTDNTGTVASPAYGTPQVTITQATAGTWADGDTASVASIDADGVTTTTTYTYNATADKYTTSVTTSIPAGTGLLKQGADDLTNLTVTSGNVDTLTTSVDNAIKAVTDYSSQLGAAKSRISSQQDFVSKLSDALTSAVSTLVDADMNTESTRLQALQVQQQLGIQSLSIANQNSQLILKLFQ